MLPRGRPRRADVYARFEAAAADLARLGGLPSPVEAAGIWYDIWHLEAYNSTAIEGNTLILREVEALLDTGRAVGAKELRDYLEVAGYGQAAKWVYTQALTADGWQSGDLITVTEIRRIHTVALGPVWEVAPHPAAKFESPSSVVNPRAETDRMIWPTPSRRRCRFWRLPGSYRRGIQTRSCDGGLVHFASIR